MPLQQNTLRGIHLTYTHTFDKFVHVFAYFVTYWIKVIHSYKLLYGGYNLVQKNCTRNLPGKDNIIQVVLKTTLKLFEKKHMPYIIYIVKAVPKIV